MSATHPPLTDEQLEGLLGLVKRADSVELKLTVPVRRPCDGRPPSSSRSTPCRGPTICSGSMKGVPGAPVKEAVAGKRALRKLFSKEQRAFFAAHAPDGLELDDLSVLGPLFVLKLKLQPQGFDRKLVTEVWI